MTAGQVLGWAIIAAATVNIGIGTIADPPGWLMTVEHAALAAAIGCAVLLAAWLVAGAL